MIVTRSAFLSLVGAFIVAACGSAAPSEANLAPTIDAAVKGTVAALATQPQLVDTPTASQAPTSTSTLAPIPAESPTLSPQVAVVSVSQATNCRTGPGQAYPQVLSFQPGKVAEVVGRSTIEDYWYIVSPDQSSERCWLWGQYATVQGDTGSLPVFTPEAPPGPSVNFVMYRYGFTECGPTRVSLVVTNTGAATFRSARVRIEDLTASSYVYGPSTDSSPFGDNPTSCPKDKGKSSLAPGATAYIVIPMKDFDAGHDAAAYVRLCTEDDARGSCITRAAFFRFPSN